MTPHPVTTRGAWAFRAAIALLVLLPLGMLGASRAADRPEAKYPHGKFRGNCDDCHGSAAWSPVKAAARANHAKHGFPLEGAHAALDCKACHAQLDFSQSRRVCASCHEDPHRGELGVDCARCHGAGSFLDPGVMRRMHEATRFPLTGSHAGLDCESCHPPAAAGHLQYVNTRANCEDCHMDLYRSVKQPDHVAGGFPTACAQCHSTLGWSTGRVDHSRTGFPLTGAHATVACAGCHGDGVYAGKSTACVSCHRSKYDGTTDPNHAAAGFPTDCRLCHNTTSWSGATFDHSGTRFPLTGAHIGVVCAGCHGDGVYAGKSTACVSCHQSSYDATTNPNHAAAGFPTDCVSCHTTTTWSGATFDHDARFFPIYSGAHLGRWSACSDCHTNAANFAVFSCFSCHGKSSTDSHHTGVSGYVYDSNACYSCHPRGRAG